MSGKISSLITYTLSCRTVSMGHSHINRCLPFAINDQTQRRNAWSNSCIEKSVAKLYSVTFIPITYTRILYSTHTAHIHVYLPAHIHSKTYFYHDSAMSSTCTTAAAAIAEEDDKCNRKRKGNRSQSQRDLNIQTKIYSDSRLRGLVDVLKLQSSQQSQRLQSHPLLLAVFAR